MSKHIDTINGVFIYTDKICLLADNAERYPTKLSVSNEEFDKTEKGTSWAVAGGGQLFDIEVMVTKTSFREAKITKHYSDRNSRDETNTKIVNFFLMQQKEKEEVA